MKPINKLLITIIIAVLVVSVYALIFSNVNQPKAIAEAPQNISAPKTVYLIKEYNGKIAVFLNNEPNPINILESPFVRDLPEYDQRILKEGIIAQSNQELLKILEDYDN